MSAMTDHEHETAADKRLYVEIGLVPVSCTTCGVEVSVKKNSRKHTSVQWTAAAMAGCAHFDAVGALGVSLGCPRLRESIKAAVADGRVVVPDE
jgi:hypothetical protein